MPNANPMSMILRDLATLLSRKELVDGKLMDEIRNPHSLHRLVLDDLQKTMRVIELWRGNLIPSSMSREYHESTESCRAGSFCAATVNVELARLLRRAKEGDAEAQFALGKYFENQEERTKNDVEAAYKWYFSAHDSGHAEAAHSIGKMLYSIGLLDDAGDWLETAVKVKQGIFGDAIEAAHAFSDLGACRVRQERFGVGRGFLAIAVEMFKKAKDRASLFDALRSLGNTFRLMGSYDEAVVELESAVELAKDSFGIRSLEWANAVCDLSDVYEELGDFDKAETGYLAALEAIKSVDTQDSERRAFFAHCSNNLGHLYHSLNRHNDSMAVHEASVEYQISHGAIYLTTAIAFENMACLLEELGDLPGAIQKCRSGLEIRQKLFPDVSPKVATGLEKLAGFVAWSGDYDQGIELFGRAAAIFAQANMRDDESRCRMGMALVSLESGRVNEACEFASTAIDLLSSRDTTDYAISLANLSTVLAATGDLEISLSKCREAAELLRQLCGEESAEYAIALKNLSVMDTSSDSDALHEKALQIAENVFAFESIMLKSIKNRDVFTPLLLQRAA